MNKPFRLLTFSVVAVVFIGLCTFWLGRSRGQGALAKYKTELRARGEKISWAELGYPRPPQTNDSLPRLLTAVDQLGDPRFEPGMLALMNFVGPGRAHPCWLATNPRLISKASTRMGTMSWSEFDQVFQQAEANLAAIRAALDDPPRYFINDPSNFLNQPKIPFIQQRKAAQWLSGDTIRALHGHRRDEAREDLHALTQLIHLHEEDPTLVSQMIRIAIAGLALADTWEAMQGEGWSEEALTMMQRDWEGVELLAALERGIESERAFGECAFAYMRTASANLLTLSNSQGNRGASDYFNQWVVTPLWRANSEADELFFLQHHQRCLYSIRRLQRGSAGPLVNAELTAHYTLMDKVIGNRLSAIRHMLSAFMIPNAKRATQTTVKAETQRRLTVTVIALERYKLRHANYPAELAALVPECLSAVPLDLMSGKPFGYRLHTDGTFTLYSVGEDGRDDDGDAASPTATNKFDLWSGRDAVWPKAADQHE